MSTNIESPSGNDCVMLKLKSMEIVSHYDMLKLLISSKQMPHNQTEAICIVPVVRAYNNKATQKGSKYAHLIATVGLTPPL